MREVLHPEPVQLTKTCRDYVRSWVQFFVIRGLTRRYHVQLKCSKKMFGSSKGCIQYIEIKYSEIRRSLLN